MDWGKVAKDLLAISEWPWGVASGNFITCKFHGNDPDTGLAVAEVDCRKGSLPDLKFIAAAPRLLAEALVEKVTEVTRGHLDVFTTSAQKHPDIQLRCVVGALTELRIDPVDYDEIKRRLG